MASKAVQRLPKGLTTALTIIGGALYIFALVGVNLVGYAVGVGGMSDILKMLVSWQGLGVLGLCFYFLCWGVLLMMHLRSLGWAKG